VRFFDLAEVEPSLEPVVGGKAVGLGRLLAAEVLVSPGFAVEATSLPPPQWPEAARAELERRTALLLAGGRLAVRSSAPGEDSRERSFAGLFETVLGVATVDAALEAAARCVASGAGERVRAYAGGTRPVGLVVQQQVEARLAGVCFTADPAGRDGAIVLEAVAGTGDALVSGRAEPERWRVYRTGLGTLEAHRSGPSSGLGAEEAASLAAAARALAERWGEPIDLEWAIDAAGRVFWLQARPVTALVPAPALEVQRFAEGVDDGPVTVWGNWNVRETMPDPLTPLSWGVWRESILPAALEPLIGVPPSSPIFPKLMAVDLVQGRLYWNMNGLEASWMGGLFRRGALRRIDAKAADIAERLRCAGVLKPRRVLGAKRALLRGVGHNLVLSTRGLRALDPERVVSDLRQGAVAVRRRPPLAELGDEALFSELRLLEAREMEGLRAAQNAIVVAFLVAMLADRAFRPHPEARARLFSGLSGNPTTEIALGIDELVEAARPLDAAFADDPGWRARLDAFLDRNGQRCPREFDLTAVRWREDPRPIVELVRASLGSPAGERATDRLARQAAERRRAIGAALEDAPPWRRPVLRRLAALVERYMPLREAPKHYAMAAFERIRGAALELGRRLVARGVVGRAEDVFFLEWSELRELARGSAAPSGLAATIADRRRRHDRFRALAAPHFVRSDGVPVIEDEEAPRPDGSLRGEGVSAGEATGPVRILREPDPRAMRDGDVIVVTLADPGWTPLFPRAAAVVMEVGGTLCHAAVVARELGIPAVFGVVGATSRLRDGERVRVDGRTGTVTPAG
jgi:phosphohistidine swiveling domain-containing protein